MNKNLTDLLPPGVINMIPPSQRAELEKKIANDIVPTETKIRAFLVKYGNDPDQELTDILSCPKKYNVKGKEAKPMENGVAVIVTYEEFYPERKENASEAKD